MARRSPALMTQTAAVIALLVALVVSAPTFGMPRVDLVILHTNDMHARIEPNVDNEILGMPYIAALVRHYRAMYPHVLVIDAGDTLHGRPISDRLHGERSEEHTSEFQSRENLVCRLLLEKKRRQITQNKSRRA